MTAYTLVPSRRFSLSADDVVIEETIWLPPAIAMTTSVLTGPFLLILTVPGIWLRALIFMVFTGGKYGLSLFNVYLKTGRVSGQEILSRMRVWDV
jgi:hypothetical protein